MPGKSFLIAGMIAWAGIAAAVIAGSQEPTSAPAASAPVKAEFDERWEDAPEPALLKKQDRLPLPEVSPIPVQVERVVVLQPKTRVAATTQEPKKKSMREGICAKGKRWITKRNGWRSWRCRR